MLSPKSFNIATGYAFVVPITNQVKGSLFEVTPPPGGKVTGVVLANQLRSLDWLTRRAELIGRTTPDLVQEVLARIEAVLR